MKSSTLILVAATALAGACTHEKIDRDLNISSPPGQNSVRHNMMAQAVPTGPVGKGVPGTSGVVQGAAFDRYLTGEIYKPRLPGTSDAVQGVELPGGT